MVLRNLGSATIGIKTATTAVQIKESGSIRVGEHSIEGPGEYDVAGVGVHAAVGYAVLFTEGIRLAVIWDGEDKIDPEDETDIDGILFLLQDVKVINSVVKEQDPRFVVLIDAPTADEVAKQEGVTVQNETNFKITSSTLPSEDRQFILLST